MALFTRRTFVLAGTAGVLTACSGFASQGATMPEQLSTSVITARVNAARRAHGRSELAYNGTLAGIARRQADVMARRDTLSHDLDGSLARRVRAAGYDGLAGENVSAGYRTLEAVIDGWLNSPGHRKNLLNSRFTEFGLAAARTAGGRDSRYGIYWAIVFGYPVAG